MNSHNPENTRTSLDVCDFKSAMVNTTEDQELTSSMEHRRVLRKLDRHLLPLVSLLYLLSFLDRANIGNARVAGMGKDLKLVGLKYNIAASVFFIPYCLAEVPSNIALKLFRPSRWIPNIMLAWGLVMTLMCLVNNYRGLLISRAFLGLCEAGLFPGVAYYLSLWYPKQVYFKMNAQAMRFSIFFSAATIAGAFGGLLAFGIGHMEGIGGLHGWQWIFCLEGLMTIIVAFGAYFCMHDYPETAKFLSASERAYVVQVLKDDSSNLSAQFNKKFIWQALTDYKIYLQIALYMGVLIPIYAIALFIPTIIHELGFSAARAQLLTVPPFVCGCLSTVLIGVYSDKYKVRGPFIIGGALLSLVGYFVLYTQSGPWPSYVGTILASIGMFPTIPVDLAWVGGNVGGSLKRSMAFAMIIGIGNLGGICSSFIYIDPPRFHIGHGTCIGWLSLTAILTCVAMWNYTRLNKKKEAICAWKGIDSSRQDEFADLGDDSPLFRYAI